MAPSPLSVGGANLAGYNMHNSGRPGRSSKATQQRTAPLPPLLCPENTTPGISTKLRFKNLLSASARMPLNRQSATMAVVNTERKKIALTTIYRFSDGHILTTIHFRNVGSSERSTSNPSTPLLLDMYVATSSKVEPNPIIARSWAAYRNSILNPNRSEKQP